MSKEKQETFNKFFDRALKAENLIKQLKSELDRLTKRNAQLESRLNACLYGMMLMQAHTVELQTNLHMFEHPFKPEEYLTEDKLSMGE